MILADSSMKIYDRKPHVLVTMEDFSNSMIFYQTPIRRSVRREQIWLKGSFLQKYGKISKYKICESQLVESDC